MNPSDYGADCLARERIVVLGAHRFRNYLSISLIFFGKISYQVLKVLLAGRAIEFRQTLSNRGGPSI